jgi:hypothetical protein
MIHQAASENLLLHRLVNTHHQGLSETEMRKEIDEMRINKLAVNQALGEVGKLYDISQSHRALLDDLHINGKSDPEKSNLFHKLINSEANERQTRTAIAEIQPDVERRAAVAFGLDPYKFDGYNMYQSQLIKCAANYHGGIDPTPYITPDTESGEIATIIRIIEQSDPSCNNPLNYSPEQILAFRKLTHDTLEYETPLAYTIMNPEYSVDEMNYIVSWAQQNNLDEAFKFIPGDYDIPQMIEEYRQNSELQEQFKNKQTEVKAEAEMFANSNLSTELPEESLHAKINQLEQSYEKYTTELEAVQNSQKAYLIKYETETGKEFIAVDSKNELLHYLQQEHPSRFDSLSPDRFWNAIESPDVDEMVRQSLNASQDLYENGSLSEYAFAISHYHEVEPPEVKDISDLKEQYQEQQSDLEH